MAPARRPRPRSALRGPGSWLHTAVMVVVLALGHGNGVSSLRPRPRRAPVGAAVPGPGQLVTVPPGSVSWRVGSLRPRHPPTLEAWAACGGVGASGAVTRPFRSILTNPGKPEVCRARGRRRTSSSASASRRPSAGIQSAADAAVGAAGGAFPHGPSWFLRSLGGSGKLLLHAPQVRVLRRMRIRPGTVAGIPVRPRRGGVAAVRVPAGGVTSRSGGGRASSRHRSPEYLVPTSAVIVTAVRFPLAFAPAFALSPSVGNPAARPGGWTTLPVPALSSGDRDRASRSVIVFLSTASLDPRAASLVRSSPRSWAVALSVC